MLTSHSDSRASLKKPRATECLEAASASLICVIQYEIEDSVLNLRLAVDMDTSGVSNLPWLFDLLDRIPDTGVTVPEGVGLGLAPGLVCIECLRGGLADLSFTERSRHMLLLTSEGGFALYKESDEKCFVRAMLVHIHVKLEVERYPAKILDNYR